MRTPKYQAVIGSAAIVLAGVLAGAAPAQAAPVAPAAGGTAPACIDRSGISNIPDGGMHGYVYNYCGKPMTVRIIVDSWRDTSCQTIPNGGGKFFHTVGGRYDRTAVC
ncbi:hypothetical protein ACFQVC_23650 [Streptomyces monticola]|uniref:Uncharacterized protein n=1 Tax=Streptomyces monticola TaxID=2666263 RepID=A0ABW2JM43_9ACTN